jgi:aspartyl-tRNA(Asn)/glutamyl-tRNA(Gln) amidotransferase subunit B
VVQETRGWSEAEQRTFSQRSKEFAKDYRYFPEPDLPPLELDPKWIEALRAALPEMPGARRARLISEYGLPVADASQITADVLLANLFEATVKGGAEARPTANWIIGEVAPSGKLPSPAVLAEIVKLVTGGSITRDQARQVLAESVSSNRAPAEIVAERGFAQDSDEASIKAIVEAVVAANPKAVEDYRAGKKQALGALMADVKKRAPQANPKVANSLLQQLLG